MISNLDYTAKELFNKLRTRFKSLKLGDEASGVTNTPAKARFFDFAYSHNGADLGRVTISIEEGDPDLEPEDRKPSLNVIYGSDLIADLDPATKNQWYTFLRSMREFSRMHGLNFDTRDIEKSQLTKRDYAFLSGSKGEQQMSESKLYGTNRTSWQDIGNAKIVIKHSQPINIDLPQGRSLNIESIYIENIEGERFKFNGSLTAARAMARHVSEGGTTYDDIGIHITGLNEELGKLRHFKNYVQRHGALSENFSDLTTRVLTRIEDIKSELHSLQRESGYAAYRDQFAPAQSKEVPEDLINDWVDKLTLRSFNEELKDVFPYLYNLVEAPIKDIEFTDIVGEEQEQEVLESETELPEYAEFESSMMAISAEHEDVDPYQGNQFAQMVRELQSKGATLETSFTTNEGQTYTLADVMERAGLPVEDFFDISEERTEVKDKDGNVISWRDEGEWKKVPTKKDPRGKVTNLSDKARRETEKMKSVSENMSGRTSDQLAQAVYNQSPDLSDEDEIMRSAFSLAKQHLGDRARGIFRDEDFAGDLLDAYRALQQGMAEGGLNPKERAKAQMMKMYGDGQITFSKTSNGGYFIQHEDDFGDTNSHQYDPTTGKVDSRGSMSSTYYGEGVAEGKKPCPQCGSTSCTCPPGKCNCKPIKGFKKDVHENDEDQIAKSKKKALPNTGNPMRDVKEFVESFFDRETGKFPKGETGVMVAVDKKFGENAVPVAKKVIEMLKVQSEQTRIRELAGLAKKY